MARCCGGTVRHGGNGMSDWRFIAGVFPMLRGCSTRPRLRGSGGNADLPVFPADAKGIGSRDASGMVLNGIAPRYPWLVGGGGDLAPCTKTLVRKTAAILKPDRPGAIFISGFASMRCARL